MAINLWSQQQQQESDFNNKTGQKRNEGRRGRRPQQFISRWSSL